MKKLSSIFLLSLIFLLFSSCERPDLTDDVEMAYEIAARNNSGSDYTDTADSDYTDTADSSSSSCKTIDGYMWSSKSSDYMTWDDAVSYCDNLTECGYSNWHLPTISELRTLIQNCSGTVTGGSCGVTDSCLSYSNCWSEESCDSYSYDESGGYSKLGDTSWFWSSSVQSDYSDRAWNVSFNFGTVFSDDKYHYSLVRCVRSNSGSSSDNNSDSGSESDSGSDENDTAPSDIGDTSDNGDTDNIDTGDTKDECAYDYYGMSCTTDQECGNCMICVTGGKCVNGCQSDADCASYVGTKCNTKLARCVNAVASYGACSETSCPTGCCYADSGLTGVRCAAYPSPGACGLCPQGEIYSPEDSKCLPAACSITADNCPSINSYSRCYSCKAGELICEENPLNCY